MTPCTWGLFIKQLYCCHSSVFFRISNLFPHSNATFQPLKQLARGDIFFAAPGAHVLLKWSKTLQMNNSVRLLKIPQLGSSVIGPVNVLKNLLSLTPRGSNKLLFQIKLVSGFLCQTLG